MAIKLDYVWKQNNVTWRSGHFYQFRYKAWGNDPKPMIIAFYRITGINPNTGHQWRLIQGINLNYIPRSHRKLFVSQWKHNFEVNNGNVKFAYEDMKRKYPWLRFGVRRYMTKPTYYIQNTVEIEMDNIEEAVLSTYDKDFSNKLKAELVGKYKRVKDRTKKQNRMTSKSLFGGANGVFRSIFKWGQK